MSGPSGPPKIEGELKKYRNFWHGWKTRYFKLERSYLHYFETKHSMPPVGTITRNEIVEVKQSNAFPDKKNVFEIVQKSGHIWQVQAASTAEMLEWMKALSPVPLVLDTNQHNIVPTDGASNNTTEPDISWPKEKPGIDEEQNDQPQFSVPYPELPRMNESGEPTFPPTEMYPHLQQHHHGDENPHPSAPFFCSPPPPYSETDQGNQHPGS